MADKKISELNELASSGVNPSDLIAIVSSAETKKVSVGSLLAASTGTVTPLYYGAVGDGVTNDTTAVLACVAAGADVDGQGLTFVVNSPIILAANQEVSNLTIDFTGAGATDACFRGVESFAATDSLTANTAVDDNQVTIADTSGYAVGDVVKVTSSRTWSNDGSTTVTSGETARVEEVVSGTVLRLNVALGDAYTTADSAAVSRFGGTLGGHTLRRVKGIGDSSTGTQYGTVFARVADVKIIDCEFENFGNSGPYLEDCYGFDVIGCHVTSSANSSQGYGVTSLSACRNGNVAQNTFSGCRTGYTHGGTSGVGRGLVAQGNLCIGCFTAGINSKNSSDGMVVNGNTVQGDNTSSGLGDGIRMRGSNPVITGNFVTGLLRYPIYVPLYGHAASGRKTATITGNTVTKANNIACFIDQTVSETTNSVVVSGNTFDHEDDTSSSKGSIHIRCSAGTMSNIVVCGNVVSNCPYNCLDVRTSGSGAIANYRGTGNVLERNATAIAAGRAAIVTSGPTNSDTTGNVTV